MLALFRKEKINPYILGGETLITLMTLYPDYLDYHDFLDGADSLRPSGFFRKIQ
jgi:hypothetical protein